jgi:peptidoglycan/LPS O-acetylase OafA/YrhL
VSARAEVVEAVAPSSPNPARLPDPRRSDEPLSSIFLMPGAFRLLLASAVVINHYTKLQIGTAAVELFFILSGYWIDRMYGRQYSILRAPAFVFITSRFMRLMPLFLPFNIAAIMFHLALHTKAAPDHIGLDLLPNVFILGYASMTERPLVPAWSLDIELQFYLLFPFIWTLFSRSRATLACATIVLLGAGGWYLGYYLRDQSTMVLPYLGFFAIGIYASRAAWKPAPLLVWSGAGLAAFIVLLTMIVPLGRGILLAGDGLPGRDWNTAANVVLAISFAPLAIFTVTRRSTPRDRVVGDLSYAVYCSHWLGVIVAGYYLPGVGALTKLPIVVTEVALTYLISLGALLWFDRPIGRLREAWIHAQPIRSGASFDRPTSSAV